MKKIVYFMVVMIMFLLSSCAPSSVDNETPSYTFDRTGIIEMKGTSQISENVKTVIIAEENIEQLLSDIEALDFKETGKKNNEKGWEYYFLITYDDGKTIGITFLDEKVNIDGYVYNTSLYNSSDFFMYFDEM